MSELFGGIEPLQRALNYHLERHNIIASNVANVDTPGFKPMELLRVEAQRAVGSLDMVTTRDGHMGVRSGQEAAPFVAVSDSTVRAGNDGNAVSLDREMSRLAANDLRYDGAAKMVARQLGLLRYAANGGNG